MSESSAVYDDFDDDDEFFMNEIIEDERDRSNNLAFVEADSPKKGTPPDLETDDPAPALVEELNVDLDNDNLASESDEDIVILSELTSVPKPPDPTVSTTRRLRSQTKIIDSNSINQRSIPLLPTTRSKRQRLTVEAKEPSASKAAADKAAKTKRRRTRLKGGQDLEKVSRRLYNVKFVSQLDGSIGKVYQEKVSGNREFGSILESVLGGMVKEFDVCEDLKPHYRTDSVTLYWNNGKLLKFMTCDSLRIQRASEEELVDVEITAVHTEREQEYEERLSSRIMRLDNTTRSLSYDQVGLEANENDVSRNEKVDKLIDVTSGLTNSNATTVDLDKELNCGVIKIALVGEDNKRLHVQVRQSTPFSKVAEYYKLQKSLAKTTQIKLIFDHEELDPNETVADQDMENDDMIEVLL